MTPKRVLIGLAAALSLGVPMAACGSVTRGTTATPKTNHPSVTTTLAPVPAAPPSVVSSTVARSAHVHSTASAACGSNVAERLVSTGQAAQLVVVDATTYTTT